MKVGFAFDLMDIFLYNEGLWIIPWDHEADCEIECVYTSLVEFLRDMEEDNKEH